MGAVAVLIVSGLTVLHSEVDSDYDSVYPTIIDGSGTRSCDSVIGGVPHTSTYNSTLHVLGYTGEGGVASISIRVMPQDIRAPYNLHYIYEVDGECLLPKDGVLVDAPDVPGGGDYYRHVDPVTGDELRFHVEGPGSIRVDFIGETMVNADGGLRSVDFKITDWYQHHGRLVRHLDVESGPGDEVLFLRGSENGADVEGSVTVNHIETVLLSPMEELVPTIVKITGTGLPEMYTRFPVVCSRADSEWSVYEYDAFVPYLTAGGDYISIECDPPQSSGGHTVFAGRFTITHLDENRVPIGADTTEFEYEVG